jgi:hypothetical protein
MGGNWKPSRYTMLDLAITEEAEELQTILEEDGNEMTGVSVGSET